jgi:urease accessory protein
VAVAVAARAAAAEDLAGCLAIDALLDAAKCVAEFREASRQMGRQVARVGAALVDDGFVAAFGQAVEAGRTPGHHPVVFGIVTRRAGADPESAALAYLYATAAQITGTALRLLPLGQLEAQRALAAVRPRIRRLAAAAARADAEDMWSFTPGIEIAGWRHAQLEARLFRS